MCEHATTFSVNQARKFWLAILVAELTTSIIVGVVAIIPTEVVLNTNTSPFSHTVNVIRQISLFIVSILFAILSCLAFHYNKNVHSSNGIQDLLPGRDVAWRFFLMIVFLFVGVFWASLICTLSVVAFIQMIAAIFGTVVPLIINAWLMYASVDWSDNDIELQSNEPVNDIERQSNEPSTVQNQTVNVDILDERFSHVTHHSPKLASCRNRALMDVSPTPAMIMTHVATSIMQMINEQETTETSYYPSTLDIDKARRSLFKQRQRQPSQSCGNERFALCRSHITPLDLITFENSQNINLLKTSKTNCEQVLRELTNLDPLNCRETHKIGIIYLGYGQEDKTSIFNNDYGSVQYEEFLSHLGGKVELSKHTGFCGGLYALHNTHSIYYADAFVEIMFHMATMIGGTMDEDHMRKARYISNDGVQIIWTGHCHEYNRSIIAGAFDDVLIVIHPLPNALYRIRIDKSNQITNFGPLFDGAIVDKLILPELVRVTAINASRARRTTLDNSCEFSTQMFTC